jgi:hypothetical protein
MTVKELKDVSMNPVEVAVPAKDDWDEYLDRTNKTYKYVDDGVDELTVDWFDVEDERVVVYTA